MYIRIAVTANIPFVVDNFWMGAKEVELTLRLTKTSGPHCSVDPVGSAHCIISHSALTSVLAIVAHLVIFLKPPALSCNLPEASFNLLTVLKPLARVASEKRHCAVREALLAWRS